MTSVLPDELVPFLQELALNNNRDWFAANKKRFEQHVKKPFEEFVDVLIDRTRLIEPGVLLTAKDAIFRIYRDTRFSADKSPYKDHLGAVISPGGRKNPNGQGFYLEVSDSHIRMYAGAYMPDKEMLYRIRERIATQPVQFRQLIKDKEFVQYFGTIHGDKNKVLPAEWKQAAMAEPYIYNKNYYFYTEWPSSYTTRPDLIDDILHRYQVARPLTLFLTNFK